MAGAARALVAASRAAGSTLLGSLALSCASLPILSFLLQTWHWIASCGLIRGLLALLLIALWTLLLVALRALLRSSTLCSRAVCWPVTLQPRLGLSRGRSYLTVWRALLIILGSLWSADLSGRGILLLGVLRPRLGLSRGRSYLPVWRALLIILGSLWSADLSGRRILLLGILRSRLSGSIIGRSRSIPISVIVFLPPGARVSVNVSVLPGIHVSA